MLCGDPSQAEGKRVRLSPKGPLRQLVYVVRDSVYVEAGKKGHLLSSCCIFELMRAGKHASHGRYVSAASF